VLASVKQAQENRRTVAQLVHNLGSVPVQLVRGEERVHLVGHIVTLKMELTERQMTSLASFSSIEKPTFPFFPR